MRVAVYCEKCRCIVGQIDDDVTIDQTPYSKTRILCVNCAEEENR